MMQPQCLLLLLSVLCSPLASAYEWQSQANCTWWSWIVGGQEAKPHSLPYMAYLRKANGSFCGGILVEPDWVLTAAYCIGSSMVILGAHDISILEKTQQRFTVQSVHPHPNYNSRTKKNDIALLKLHEKATITAFVKVIRLPNKRNTLSKGTKCSTAGWGLNDQEKPSNKLHKKDVIVHSWKDCSQLYPSLSKKSICAGSNSRNRDSNTGDEGNPLICNEVPQGILSQMPFRPPAFYTLISPYYDWIQETKRKASN
ncbi:mast cell protease 3-like [Alligator mississippiensis]|uniref:Mast cell protease 3-like n=2 Tax=Alligator mississippiensis TaxID=8496 RepID=A0A151P0P6_ALLMI|nr:mast cell protease 3-like [Alligator mississippiensis]